jgi:hypothetical protein
MAARHFVTLAPFLAAFLSFQKRDAVIAENSILVTGPEESGTLRRDG